MKAKRKPVTKGTRARQHAAAQLLSQAYMNQEGDICDLLTMANIADQLTSTGQKLFAAGHLRDMIDDFRQKWYDQHKASAAGGHEVVVS